MFRFRLGSIPVTVHLSHFVVSLLFALSFRPQGGSRTPQAWPDRYLLDPAGEEYPRTLAAFVVGWMLLVFVSVLVHELGHAVVSRAYGYAPSIRLLWLGGHTESQPGAPIPWHRDVLLTLAGPAFGTALGVLAVLIFKLAPPGNEIAAYFLGRLAWANFIWAVLNLMPVTPLDGGRVVRAVVVRLLGPKGEVVAHLLGGLAALTLGALTYRYGMHFLTLLFLYFAFQNFALAMAFKRAAAQTKGGSLVGELQMGQARDLYEQGRLPDARRVAESALNLDLAPEVRGSAHHLLGWISLKEGNGRAALDQFAQVQGGRVVEPHALAAAFSLIGDDLRALPLWEAAHRAKPDPLLLHEWAATLLRLGRDDDMGRLGGVDLFAALRCAERVLFIRGEFAQAAALGSRALSLKPSAGTAYDVACALARAGDKEGAVGMLHRAVTLGFSDAAAAEADEDLSPLRSEAPFVAWLTSLRESTPR
jgi:Zn-dependent protease